MKRVNFRISETAYEQLKQLAEQNSESMNTAVQRAIKSAVKKRGFDVQENGSENLWKELFLEEHEKLLSLTEKVAESLQASQTLQAMDKPALESSEQKKSRLQRLREAWRG